MAPVSDPSPWLAIGVESLGAFGSAGAAIVAVVLAGRERQERRAAQAELAAMRALEAESAARMNAAHTVATVKARKRQRMISTGMGKRQAEEPGGSRWVVTVNNAGSSPIRDVRIAISPADAPHIVDELTIASALLANQERTLSTKTLRHEIDGADPAFLLTFTTADGQQWVLDQRGNVQAVTRP